MAEIKMTKNELRGEQYRLSQLERYLPTLQLKKAMLQAQVSEMKQEIERLRQVFQEKKEFVENFCILLSENIGAPTHGLVQVKKIKKEYENIAGVEVPVLLGIEFEELHHELLTTPLWLEQGIVYLKELIYAKYHVLIAEEKKEALEKELREVSTRVNLFEKILIPRALKNIKKIRIFLGDQELAAVCQAKVAKSKIEQRKQEKQVVCESM